MDGLWQKIEPTQYWAIPSSPAFTFFIFNPALGLGPDPLVGEVVLWLLPVEFGFLTISFPPSIHGTQIRDGLLDFIHSVQLYGSLGPCVLDHTTKRVHVGVGLTLDFTIGSNPPCDWSVPKYHFN